MSGRILRVGRGEVNRQAAAILRAMSKRVLAITVALVCAVLWTPPLMGCSEESTDRTPGGALTLFLAAMERSQWDAEARRDAYRLMAPSTRERLQERASMTNALGSREFEPWEMLAQGRFRLLLDVPPESDLDVQIDGEEAVITVRGGESEARVPMVMEEGRWRVRVEIPSIRPTSSDTPADIPRLEAADPG